MDVVRKQLLAGWFSRIGLSVFSCISTSLGWRTLFGRLDIANGVGDCSFFDDEVG
jgi:hypothetical protein